MPNAYRRFQDRHGILFVLGVNMGPCSLAKYQKILVWRVSGRLLGAARRLREVVWRFQRCLVGLPKILEEFRSGFGSSRSARVEWSPPRDPPPTLPPDPPPGPPPGSLLGGQQGGFAPTTTRREIEAKRNGMSENGKRKTPRTRRQVGGFCSQLQPP